VSQDARRARKVVLQLYREHAPYVAEAAERNAAELLGVKLAVDRHDPARDARPHQGAEVVDHVTRRERRQR
jgi:hypothetical protein